LQANRFHIGINIAVLKLIRCKLDSKDAQNLCWR